MLQLLYNLLSGLYTLLSKTFPLLLCALFPALLVIGRNANAPRAERWKNALNPYLALAFTIVGCSAVLLLNDMIDGLAAYIENALDWLKFTGRPAYALALYKAFLINLVLAAAYVAVKYGGKGLKLLGSAGARLIRWAIDKLKKQDIVVSEEELLQKKQTLSQRYLGLFYDEDPDTGKRTIKLKYIKIKKIFRLASYMLMGLWLLFFLFAQAPVLKSFRWFPYDFVNNTLNAMYLFPVLSLIILFEIADFLDGEEPGEVHDITSGFVYDEKTNGMIVADYKKAVKPLKEIFQDRYGADMAAPETIKKPENRETTYKSTLAKKIEQYLKTPPSSPKKDREPLAAYIAEEDNPGILHLIDSLEMGEDCLVDASLYADLSSSFMVYLNICLCRGENILILCADDLEVQNVSRFIQERLKTVNQFSAAWIIKTEYKAMQSGDCDILITTPTALEDESVQVGQEQFFEHVQMVLVPNTVKMLICYADSFEWLIRSFSASGREYTEEESNSTEKDGFYAVSEQHVTLLMLNEGLPAELRKTVSEITGRQLNAYECFYSQATTRIIVWHEEGSKAATRPQERLFGSSFTTPYIGMIVPLGLASYQLTRTNINIISEKLPYRDIMQSMQSHTSVVNEYLQDEQGMVAFTDNMFYQYGHSAERDPVLVMEDDAYNLPSVMRNAARYRGTRAALVHVLSPRYMLRDYFLDRQKGQELDTAGEHGIFPLYSQTDAIKLKEIASEFRHFGYITESRLLDKLKDIEVLGIDPEDELETALEKYRSFILKKDVNRSLQTDYIFEWGERFNSKSTKFEYPRIIRLREGLLKKTIFSLEHEAKLLYGDSQQRLGFAGENIYQHYLPGQAVVCGGTMYRVDRMNVQKGEISAVAAPESMEAPTAFIQNRTYDIHLDLPSEQMEPLWETPKKTYGMAEVRVSTIPDMHIHVKTSGYYSLLSYDPVLRPESIIYNELSEQEIKKSERNLSAPVTVFRMTAPQGTDTQRASQLLAVVMQELMKTFFPFSWQEIAVCPITMVKSQNSDKHTASPAKGETTGTVRRPRTTAAIKKTDAEANTIQEEKCDTVPVPLTEEEVMELLYAEKAHEIHLLNEEEREKEKERETERKRQEETGEDEEQLEEERRRNEEKQHEEANRKEKRKQSFYKPFVIPELIRKAYPELTEFPFAREENEIGILFIQDSCIDNGIAQSLKKELDQPNSKLMSLARDYLEWVNKGQPSEKNYLYFGYSELPECFDLSGLIDVLDQLPRVESKGKAEIEEIEEGCCYCGCRLGTRYYILKDGIGRGNRKVCEDCFKGRVHKKTELKRIYHEAEKYLQEFDVEMPKDLKVRFASAKSIRKFIDQGDIRSVLGFARIDKNELWVEIDAPEANIMQTLIHEMTHIWQHMHLDFTKMTVEEAKRLKEGHSSFMEVRYLMDAGKKVMARMTRKNLEKRKDEYGTGFVRMLQELDNDIQGSEPFKHMLEKVPEKKKEDPASEKAS